MAAHSQYGGSVIERVIACAGSAALCASVPKLPSSPYAAEGTAAHKLAEISLKEQLHPTHWLGVEMEGFVVTQEMCDAVVVYLNAVTAEQALTKEAELYVEKGFALDLPSAEPGEVFGTNDALVYHPSTGRLRIFDYKHGVGVSVTADENAQLKFYAAGAVFSHPEWKLKEVILTIIQPRARDVDDLGAVRDWPMQTVDLLEFQGDINIAIWEAKGGRGVPVKLATGSHCRWCDAAAVCPAREAEVLEAAQLSFKDITMITTDDLPIVTELDVDRLGAVLKAADLLNDWLRTVQEYVEGLLLSGTSVPGWKVVEKIGRAKWVSDENEVASYVDMMFGVDLDQILPRKLTTIGDAEKLLKAAGAGKTEIDTFKLKFTVKDSSGLTIARNEDRRPAVNAAETAFGDVKL